MEIHLDPVGGLAGDMFIAAVLNAFPELETGLQTAIAAVEPGLAGACHLQPHNDGVLQGARFGVGEAVPHSHPHAAEHVHHHHHGHEPEADHGHTHAHGHTPWAVIRERLEHAALSPEVRTHAVGIFSELARAEAQVHGISVDAVAFHEVGAVDSIADIVGVASLIAALGTEGWSVATLPLGSGQVRTAHGFLPVPAPATALLLEGFLTRDDGVPGERVTPTGAAILRYLRCQSADARPARVLRRSGVGFGTKTLPGRSNCLRVLAFEAAANAPRRGQVTVIEFEVDDQSPEDLAIGLDHLRAEPGVLDVTQTLAFGKKGRLVTCVRVLTRPELSETVIPVCFRETTTIGLRHQTVSRVALERQAEEILVAGQTVRVKVVERPGIGWTAKPEADDLSGRPGGQDGRARLRESVEQVIRARGARA